jgi:deazaflavin-dependent oxidoreductase (nitroreductase family)
MNVADSRNGRPDLSLQGENHIRAYQQTGGEIGYMWNGVPTLLLTTTGHRSGLPRTSALIFGRDGDDILVIASYGGADNHPAWYRNLQADPRAGLQIKDKRFEAIARTATADEKPRLWHIMTDLWPRYDVYQTRTERPIPVVVLSASGARLNYRS